ncbi:NAD-dependent protein deacylase-like [Diadema antillarum]|uniref:NAD-dependent protein deacylase-like n=1 Tax=Diadema antillarum TaxID=105358 RepID=UPI003A87A5F7
MAGAGMSVDGGIPDFVDIKKALPEVSFLGLGVRELSNSELFLKNPQFAWGIFGKRMRDYRRCSPHVGYTYLLNWCKTKSLSFVYTSNIDRHFLRAGFSPGSVVECHRSLYELQCAVPCCDEVWDGSDIEVEFDERTLHAVGELPRCPSCGGVARPCTQLARDTRWLNTLSQQREREMDHCLTNLDQSRSIVVVEIGCGVQMQKVRDKSEWLVSSLRRAHHETVFVRVNPLTNHLRMPEPRHPDDIALGMTALDALSGMDVIVSS